MIELADPLSNVLVAITVAVKKQMDVALVSLLPE
jgi:hypothetical protein